MQNTFNFTTFEGKTVTDVVNLLRKELKITEKVAMAIVFKFGTKPYDGSVKLDADFEAVYDLACKLDAAEMFG